MRSSGTPELVDAVVSAISEAMPEYADLFASDLGETVRARILVTLQTFIRGDRVIDPALEAAAAWGRHEAQAARPAATVMSAFHIGARTVWGRLASAAAPRGIGALDMAELADALFDFIDRLSAASVAGYEHEVATSAAVVERERESLARALLAGLPLDVAERRAGLARWRLPRTLTPILVADADGKAVLRRLPTGSLVVQNDLPGDGQADGVIALLAPDLSGQARDQVLELRDVQVVVGASMPTAEVTTSYRWARRLWVNRPTDTTDAGWPIDGDRHLTDVIIGADVEALAELRRRVLAPLDTVPASHAERLKETLRLWLLHRGRRDLVAADLFVHHQTVRYRLAQLRELFGESLDDPNTTLELLLCLAGDVPQARELSRSDKTRVPTTALAGQALHPARDAR